MRLTRDPTQITECREGYASGSKRTRASSDAGKKIARRRSRAETDPAIARRG